MTQRGVEVFTVPVVNREASTAVVKLSSWLQELGTPKAQAESLLPYADWFSFSQETLDSSTVRAAFVVAMNRHGLDMRKHKQVPYIFHNLVFLSIADKLQKIDDIATLANPERDPFLSKDEWDTIKVIALTHDILEKYMRSARRLEPGVLVNELVVQGVPYEVASDAVGINRFLTPLNAHLPIDDRDLNHPDVVTGWIRDKYEDTRHALSAPGRQGWKASIAKGIDVLANLWDTIDDISLMHAHDSKPLLYMKRDIRHYVTMYTSRVGVLLEAGLPDNLLKELFDGVQQLQTLTERKESERLLLAA